MLRSAPNESPLTRPRGTSGKVSRAVVTAGGPRPLDGPWAGAVEEWILLRARARGDREAAPVEVVDRLRPARRAGSRDEARGEHDPVGEHRDEQALDVLGNDVPATVEQRPGPRGSLEREAPAHRAADDDRLVPARRPDELHDPA